jgi:predicted outer membrane protein
MDWRKRWGVRIVGTAVLVFGGTSGVYAVAAAGSGGGPAVTPAQLIGTLHRVNQMEIEAGKMADRRGRTEAMKRYGSTLQHDHATADETLKAYARAHDIDVNAALPIGVGSQLDQGRHELDNLQQLGGAAFDREFAELMVQDHQKVIGLVDRAARQVTDPRLKAMLGEIEPNLREHERIAQNLLFEDNATTSSATRSPHQTGR